MKKIIAILFIIGCLFMLLDVNNMTIFVISKLVALILMLPSFLTIKFE